MCNSEGLVMKLQKKILLSAYACEPNKGSEPGVGWSWMKMISEIAEELHVITRANNKDAIASEYIPENVTIHYYDLPKYILCLKKGLKGIYWYYFL